MATPTWRHASWRVFFHDDTRNYIAEGWLRQSSLRIPGSGLRRTRCHAAATRPPQTPLNRNFSRPAYSSERRCNATTLFLNDIWRSALSTETCGRTVARLCCSTVISLSMGRAQTLRAGGGAARNLVENRVGTMRPYTIFMIGLQQPSASEDGPPWNSSREAVQHNLAAIPARGLCHFGNIAPMITNLNSKTPAWFRLM